MVFPFANVYLTYNSGAAWSIFSNSGQWPVYALSFFAAVVIVYLSILLWGKAAANKPLAQSWPLLLILAGAVGNLLDRLRLGAVIDFIDVGVSGHRWYIFNIADSAVTMGIIIYLFHSTFIENKQIASDA